MSHQVPQRHTIHSSIGMRKSTTEVYTFSGDGSVNYTLETRINNEPECEYEEGDENDYPDTVTTTSSTGNWKVVPVDGQVVICISGIQGREQQLPYNPATGDIEFPTGSSKINKSRLTRG